MFTTTTWHSFFAKFQGYDDQVALKFTQGFDGKVSCIGDLVMGVSKKIVAQPLGCLKEGEKWFKNKLVEKHVCI
jgi:hypothetical protein